MYDEFPGVSDDDNFLDLLLPIFLIICLFCFDDFEDDELDDEDDDDELISVGCNNSAFELISKSENFEFISCISCLVS